MQNEAITSSTSNMLNACDVSLMDGEMMDLGELEASQQQETNEPTTSAAAAVIKPSSTLLQETIEKLFENLSNINIENLITFWLTLSTPDYDSSSSLSSTTQFNPSTCAQSATAAAATNNNSILYLGESTAIYLLAYLNDYPFMTVKLWHLAFRMLTQLLLNSANTTTGGERHAIARVFALDRAEIVYKLVYKFISSSNEELVGDECCQSLVEFLKRFGECIVGSGECERVFKMRLFRILCASIESDGCVNRSQGPIDAQVTFIEYLIGKRTQIAFFDRKWKVLF